jgi:hypothetical protein
MQPEQKPTEVKTTPAGTESLTEPARRAWSVHFVVPTPKSMPTERLKARAELVRTALNCGTY